MYVTAKNIRPWGLDLSELTYVDAATHEEIFRRCPVEYSDVLYIKDGATTGLAAVNHLKEPFSMLSSVALLKPRRDLLNPLYLKHWLNSPDTKRELTSGMTGTAIKRLVLKQIRTAEIPLAPLFEQQRIADKLDITLARVDACRDRLARVAPLIKRFRQAVLSAAASRRLTADLDACSSWSLASVSSLSRQATHALAIGPFGSNLRVNDYRDSGVPLVFVREIRSKCFGDLRTRFVSREKAAELSQHTVQAGDLLITKMGDPPGDVAIYPDHRPPAIITADCVKWSVDPAMADVRYVAIALESPETRSRLRDITAGVAQQKISLARFRNFEIPLPSIYEQTEIVRRVDTLFAFADRLEARLASAQAAVERLTPALLAKAFRGELVPQDPADEPAAELLKRLAAQGPADAPRRT